MQPKHKRATPQYKRLTSLLDDHNSGLQSDPCVFRLLLPLYRPDFLEKILQISGIFLRNSKSIFQILKPDVGGYQKRSEYFKNRIL